MLQILYYQPWKHGNVNIEKKQKRTRGKKAPANYALEKYSLKEES